MMRQNSIKLNDHHQYPEALTDRLTSALVYTLGLFRKSFGDLKNEAIFPERPAD
jgi:hypothetical protein